MMQTAEDFINCYQELPKQEQVKVISFLEDALDLEGLQEDIRVADKRYQAVVDGKEDCIPADKFFADIEANEL